jgi:hypothetical protein
VLYVLEEDFDSCGVLVVSVASEQELPHADRISPKLEASVALEMVRNSVGCHVAIIDQWTATSGPLGRSAPCPTRAVRGGVIPSRREPPLATTSPLDPQ